MTDLQEPATSRQDGMEDSEADPDLLPVLWAIERIMDEPSIPNETVQSFMGYLPSNLLRTSILQVRLLLRQLEAEVAAGNVSNEVRVSLEALAALVPATLKTGVHLGPPKDLIKDVRAELIVAQISREPSIKRFTKLYKKLFGSPQQGEQEGGREKKKGDLSNEIWESIHQATQKLDHFDKDLLREKMGLADLVKRLGEYTTTLRRELGPNVLDVVCQDMKNGYRPGVTPPVARVPPVTAPEPNQARDEAQAVTALQQMGEAVASLAHAGGPDPLPAALRDAAAAGGDSTAVTPVPARVPPPGGLAPVSPDGVPIRASPLGRGHGLIQTWKTPEVDGRPVALPADVTSHVVQLTDLAAGNYRPPRKPPGERRKPEKWTPEEVEIFLHWVKQTGTGKWQQIKISAGEALKYRTTVDLKDKWRNLVKRNPELRRFESTRVPREPDVPVVATTTPISVKTMTKTVAGRHSEDRDDDEAGPSHSKRRRLDREDEEDAVVPAVQQEETESAADATAKGKQLAVEAETTTSTAEEPEKSTSPSGETSSTSEDASPDEYSTGEPSSTQEVEVENEDGEEASSMLDNTAAPQESDQAAPAQGPAQDGGRGKKKGGSAKARVQPRRGQQPGDRGWTGGAAAVVPPTQPVEATQPVPAAAPAAGKGGKGKKRGRAPVKLSRKASS